MAIILDETTRSAYLAESLASTRAALVVSALTGSVSVEIRDGVGALRASGVMTSPWAISTGATVSVGQATGAGITISNGGVPNSSWYCQFRSGTRFVRGSFGTIGSGADFTWSLSTFATNSRGTLAAVSFTATGDADPPPLGESGWQGGAGAPVLLRNTPLPDAVAGQAYTFALPWTGTQPATWAIRKVNAAHPDVDLASWVTLNPSTGVLSGTAPTVGEFNQFGVTVTNSFGSATTDYSLTVTPRPVSIIEDDIWFATIGESYSQQLSANGTGPITWSATGLPADMSISSTGLVSAATATGSPGDTIFTVTATNASGSVSKQYKLTKIAKLSTRVHKGDLSYIGAFRFPSNVYFTYSGSSGRGSGIALTNRGTMFVAGRDLTAQTLPVCEITIPTPRIESTVSALPTASYAQSWVNAYEKNPVPDFIAANVEVAVVALHWEAPNTLYVQAGYHYESSTPQRVFKRSDSLTTTGTVVGPAKVITAESQNSRAFAGIMTAVPAAAQSAYNIGPIMNGGYVGSIGAGGSMGPTAAFWSGSQLTGTADVTAKRGMFYDYISLNDYSRTLPYLFTQPSVGNLTPQRQNKWFSIYTTQMNGAVWVSSGSRKAILYFSRNGMGHPWYGLQYDSGAFSYAAEASFQLDVSRIRRDLEAGNNQGGHAPPYSLNVIAYQESELAAVLAGTKPAWQASPYDAWELRVPFQQAGAYNTHGVAHDPANRRIYVSVSSQDYGLTSPIVHVFEYVA